jgi:hypothetical protein
VLAIFYKCWAEEILQDFTDLEAQDIQACLLYAARRVNFERLAKLRNFFMSSLSLPKNNRMLF